MPAPNTITPAQLMRQIGLPDSPIVVDVRLSEDIAPDSRTIPTAIFHAYTDIDGLMDRIAGRQAVVVCHKGLKLSQGIAALIRARGHAAEVLEGGFVGWLAKDGMTIATDQIPISGLWVTRQRPKIDRIACPWLIRRFIDPAAQVMFVPRADVTAVGEKFDAMVFDTDGAPFTHVGENCSFDAMLDGFGIRTEALDRMARIIRAADTNRHDASPQAAGLLAISVGLSKQYRDDHQMLEAAIPLYDALYRWARDGFEEGHAE